ncbi:hypothetical protein CC78DRAFT_601685 [Lojkania enalia]|uniref:Uncharacterized protein n=1 Tax=Lojkania enalia TaxID=147567 RepID=A0A9P4N3F3_9PLEO|nr:hypothetical protein CC78DRAFT_601685 [Didymosphaeria enalia]
MSRIYSQAAKVHVWFGTATEDQHIPQLYNALKWLATHLKNKDTPASVEIEVSLETICGIDWRHVKLSWQWFIQGVQGLQSAFAEGMRIESEVVAALKTILTIRDSNNYKLLALLWRFHQSQCSMPQDKIYALYGSEQRLETIWDDKKKPALSEVLLAFFQKPNSSRTNQLKEAMRIQEVPFDNASGSLREALLLMIQDEGPWSSNAATCSRISLQAVVSSILEAIWQDYNILCIHGKRDAIGVGPRGTLSGDILVVPP